MKRLPLIVLITLAVLIVASIAIAQMAEHDLPWQRISGGGGTSDDGGQYALSGTIGQVEAGVMSGETGLVLSGGYWGGPRFSPETRERLYLPLVSQRE